MKSIALASLATLTLAQSAQWPSVAPSAGQSVRVLGNQSPATQKGDFWYSSNLSIDESPLPTQYVAPTPEKAVEIKTYPSVRRAQVKSQALWFEDIFGTSRAFWKLFDHIKTRDIAMTSPVEMNWHGIHTGFFGGYDADSWEMSFLYRTPSLGPQGQFGDVTVYDTEELTVLSIGVSDNFTVTSVAKAVDVLQKLLAQQTTWIQSGDPRSLGYNSPMHKTQWQEVQIPIRLASAASL